MVNMPRAHFMSTVRVGGNILHESFGGDIDQLLLNWGGLNQIALDDFRIEVHLVGALTGRGAMNTKELRNLDQKHHLHPFTHHGDMHVSGTHIVDSAKGIYVTDESGRALLDGLAGLWCVNVGYGRKEIIDSVHSQMQKVAYYPSFFNTTTESTILLAQRVTQLAPERLSHVFFSNSGSEANETALKLIRGYHKLKKTPAKSKILTLSYSYHGVTLGTTSMTQLPTCQTPFDLPLPGFLQIPGPYHYGADTSLNPVEYGSWCIEQTEKIIRQEGAETIGALFVEPIQGAGGVIVPPTGYLLELRQLCRRFDILFVADEVITGFGRVGSWFASNLWNLDPDLMTTAKGITSGYLPLGATLVSEEIAQTLIHGGYLAHGCTYSGHPTACAAALANLDIIEKENLISRTAEITGPHFQKRLKEFEGHPAVGEVRGYGLIGAIELLPPGGKKMLSSQVFLGPKAVNLVREEGSIVRGIRNMIAMAPPLIIENSEIDTLFTSIKQALDRLWS
jgi:putrescine---pyruvate transaminase